MGNICIASASKKSQLNNATNHNNQNHDQITDKKYLISGWIRQSNIDTGLDIQTIIEYYYPYDRPYECREYFKHYNNDYTKYILSNHDRSIEHRYNIYGTAYGSVIINIADGAIYKWRIKVYNVNNSNIGGYRQLIIGIDEANHSAIKDNFAEENYENRKFHVFDFTGNIININSNCAACELDAEGMAHFHKHTCDDDTIINYNDDDYDHDHIYRLNRALSVSELNLMMVLDCNDIFNPQLRLSEYSHKTIFKTSLFNDIVWNLSAFKYSQYGYCFAVDVSMEDTVVEIESFSVKWPSEPQ